MKLTQFTRAMAVAAATLPTAFGVCAATVTFQESSQGSSINCTPAGECQVPSAVSAKQTAFLTGDAGLYAFTLLAREEFNTPPYFSTVTTPLFPIFGATYNSVDGVLQGGKGTLGPATAEGAVINEPKDGAVFLGRFDTTGPSLVRSGWYATARDFEIKLNQGLQGPGVTDALGFYLTDLGDAGGQVSVQLKQNGVNVGPARQMAPKGTENGGILFFGIYSDAAFDSVSFTVTQTAGCEKPDPLSGCGPSIGEDFFGIDSIIIGKWSQQPGGNVPEPTPLALLGVAIMVAAWRRRVAA